MCYALRFIIKSLIFLRVIDTILYKNANFNAKPSELSLNPSGAQSSIDCNDCSRWLHVLKGTVSVIQSDSHFKAKMTMPESKTVTLNKREYLPHN